MATAAALRVAVSVVAVSPATTGCAIGVSNSSQVSVHGASVDFPSVRIYQSKRPSRIVAMATSPRLPEELMKKVKESIASAKEVCFGNESSDECHVAWDEVEELSAEAAHQRARLKPETDALEEYCKDNPETDECRVYED